MKYLLLAIGLILANIAPALAADAEYLIFTHGNHSVVTVGFGDPAKNMANVDDVWIPFAPVSGDRVAQHYDYSGSSQLYTYTPPVIPPLAHPVQFIIDCNNDGTLTVAQRQNLNIMALWYLENVPAPAQNIWTLIKAGATAPQISAMQSHASANNITLP